MKEKLKNSSFNKILSRTTLASIIAGIGSVGGSLIHQETIQAADLKNKEVSSLVVPGSEAMEMAGLVQVETEYQTPFPILINKQQEGNLKYLKTVNGEEGKKMIMDFLIGINSMINEQNPKFRVQEIAGILPCFCDNANKDGNVDFSLIFLVQDRETDEYKPYTFSRESLEDTTKQINIIDLTAGGEGYGLICKEIDGKSTFTRTIEGVTEQYLDDSGEWKYYVSEEMAKRFAEFDKHGCTDWKNPCPATAEDWKNRTLLMYAKTKATPFSDETKNMVLKVAENRHSLYFTKETEINGKVYDTCSFKHGGFPSKFVAHFIVKAGGYFWEDTGIDITQVLNFGDPEKSNGFLTYSTVLGKQRRDILFDQMVSSAPVRYYEKNCKNTLPRGVEVGTDMACYGADEINELLDQWIKTGIVPKELENKLLQPTIRTSNYNDDTCDCFEKCNFK